MEHNPLGNMYCILLSGHYLPTKENWSLPKCRVECASYFRHIWIGWAQMEVGQAYKNKLFSKILNQYYNYELALVRFL